MFEWFIQSFRKPKYICRSAVFTWDGDGCLVFSFVAGQILVSKFTSQPTHTFNWVIPMNGPGQYYFEGTSEKDISLIPIEEERLR